MRDAKARPRGAILLVLPFAGILLWNVAHYYPFISDDALISLRYADRLLQGQGLTWNDGEAVEGYSNMLWVLLVALAGLLGVDLIPAARALGVLCTIAAMGALAGWSLGTTPRASRWFPPVVGLLYLSLAAPLAVWAIGGLEQPLLAALLAAAIALMFRVLGNDAADNRTVAALSVALGLLCLTRPDGPLFAVAAAASILLAGASGGMTGRLRLAILVMLGPILFYSGQLAFRWFYYGELVPNTALVKITPSATHWARGLAYVSDGLRSSSPVTLLVAASAAGLLLAPGSRRRALYLLLTIVTWTGYVVFVGGDIFPAYRHLVPLFVVFAFLLADGARLLVDRLASRPGWLIAAQLLVLILFVPYFQHQRQDRHNHRAVLERWEWECRDLALFLKDAFARQQPLVAVTAAGCLPYWSELPALDMLGLNDYYLPRHPPPDIGTGLSGHELGDGEYVLRRNPDLIVFNVGSPPHYRSGDELARLPAFHERYVPVTVSTEPAGYRGIVYINKYSEKPGLGIVATASSVTVPGILFAAQGTIARLDERARPVVDVQPGVVLDVRFESTEPLEGWTADVRASSAGLSAALQQTGATVTVSIRSHASTTVALETVVLKRPSP